MHEDNGKPELDQRLAELAARERAVELRPGPAALSADEEELARSLRRLSRLQVVVLALIIALACLLTVMIAQGQLQLPAWLRPSTTVVEPAVKAPATPGRPAETPAGQGTWVPTPAQLEALQRAAPPESPGELLRRYAPEDWNQLVKWRYVMGGTLYGAPLYAADGTTFTTCGGTVYALDGAGRLVWSWRPDSAGAGALALGSDGVLYATGNFGMVYALSQTGKVTWSFRGEGIHCGLLAAANGLLYFKTRMQYGECHGYLYALNRDGSQRWRYEPEYQFDGRPPALGPDGAVYDLSHAGTLLRVNPRGAADWQLELGENPYGPAFISGAVVVAHRTPEEGDYAWLLSALNPRTGRARWQYTLPQQPIGPPVVGPDGVIYITCYYQPPGDRHQPYRCGAWAVSPSGELVWQRDFENVSRVKPLFVRGDKLYATSNNGDLILDADGAITSALPDSEDFPELLGPGPGGLLYAQQDGELIALRE